MKPALALSRKIYSLQAEINSKTREASNLRGRAFQLEEAVKALQAELNTLLKECI